MISATPSSVRVDATALVIYQGAPNRTVTWTLTGSGTLQAINAFTDANGSAAAKYTPGTPGAIVTIQATFIP